MTTLFLAIALTCNLASDYSTTEGCRGNIVFKPYATRDECVEFLSTEGLRKLKQNNPTATFPYVKCIEVPTE